jgi:chromosome segregation ATPase
MASLQRDRRSRSLDEGEEIDGLIAKPLVAELGAARQASIDAANELQTRLSVTESLLTDINGRFNSQGDELREARDSLGEMSNANARLEANAQQAEMSISELNRPPGNIPVKSAHSARSLAVRP